MQPRTILSVALCLAGHGALAALNATVENTNLTVALVRTAPPNWPLPVLNRNWTGIELNISETVDAGFGHVATAAAQGADRISFPELWFPG